MSFLSFFTIFALSPFFRRQNGPALTTSFFYAILFVDCLSCYLPPTLFRLEALRGYAKHSMFPFSFPSAHWRPVSCSRLSGHSSCDVPPPHMILLPESSRVTKSLCGSFPPSPQTWFLFLPHCSNLADVDIVGA